LRTVRTARLFFNRGEEFHAKARREEEDAKGNFICRERAVEGAFGGEGTADGNAKNAEAVEEELPECTGEPGGFNVDR
jgi:hypothetical protein